jgi:glutamate formiminotransferase/formiminotetrahydrofolate cyclodeaminase
VRHSSGGLHYVKALGLLVEGRAQVSMNLTNFRETPIARAVEMVRLEAGRYGVGIHHTELVGLMPQEALTEAAVWYLQLDDFSSEQVLETRLYNVDPLPAAEPAPVNDSTCDFVNELAAATATPGGGSAAAYSAAMGAALVCMVAGLTIGKKKYASVEAEMYAVQAQAKNLRAELMQMVDDDASAFEALMGALRLPKDTPEQQAARTAAVEMATLNAANIPLHVSKNAVRVMELALRCAEVGNLNAISDSASAIAMSRAALTAAGYNVRININGLSEKSGGKQFLEHLQKTEKKAAEIETGLNKIMTERGGLA